MKKKSISLPPIKRKVRDAIIQSLRTGVTPRVGLQHILVGRLAAIEALHNDIKGIVDGGVYFRLVVGEYGAGKSFFLQVVRTLAQKEGLVTVYADLSPERRLYSNTGHARNLYAQMMQNLGTRTKSENAMSNIVEKFITRVRSESEKSGKSVDQVINEKLIELTELQGGYDFAMVIHAYWKGFKEGDELLQHNAIRWLRAEYSTKTEAYKDLGVRIIINDESIYAHLKLMSVFVRHAGYNGLFITLDELVNLYKISNARTRNLNYEKILEMINDCGQGSASYMGVLLAGTPEFLTDQNRGLYSYEALKSRLAENYFAKVNDRVDMNAAVLQLNALTANDLQLLLIKLRHVFAYADKARYLLSDKALLLFLERCFEKVGSNYFKTPRETIRSFIDLLSILDQNPDLNPKELIHSLDVKIEKNKDLDLIDVTS